jgi:capsular exopolysaccharide synthesis family protein
MDSDKDYAVRTELQRYLDVVNRRAWAVVLVIVVVAATAIAYVLVATPVYEGSARILIEQRAPRLMNVEEVVQSHASDDQDYYKTQQELVKSRAVLTAALESSDVRHYLLMPGSSPSSWAFSTKAKKAAGALLARLRGGGQAGSAQASANPADELGQPGPERAVASPGLWRKLRAAVDVTQVRQTHLLKVKCRSHDPYWAARLANAVAEGFVQYHVSRKAETSNEAFRFLERQKTEQERKLLEAENALQLFREEAQAVSLNTEDPTNPVVARLRRISDELTETQIQAVELAAQIGVVDQALEAPTEELEAGNERLFMLPLVASHPTVTSLRSSLYAAERELDALAEVCGPEHHAYQSALAGTERLRSRLHEVLGQLAESARPELEMLRRQERDLQQRYEEQNQEALALARQSVVYDRMTAEVDRQRRLFDVLVERMGEVDLMGDYAKTNVEVIEAAEVPGAPAKPSKMMVALQAIVVGPFLGICLAFLLDYLDQTVNTPQELAEQAGVRVLGFVPRVELSGSRAERLARGGKLGLLEPDSPGAEAYRHVRTSLFYSASAADARVLAVTSGAAGDGKTTTAANLALVIAQSGQRALLVDADLRRPMIHQIYEGDWEVGLSTVLVGLEDLERAISPARHDGSPVPNLDVLYGGPCPSSPSELLGSEAMRDLLEEAQEDYEWVVLDTTPVLSVADASIVSAVSDGVVLVVKAGKGTGALARRAREHLESVNARVLGAVLNDVRLTRLAEYSDYYSQEYLRYRRG